LGERKTIDVDGNSVEVWGAIEKDSDAGQELMFQEGEGAFRETERAYGGREAYERAKASGKTKLDYRQWIQVRTPEFKKWFGDRDALRDLQLFKESLTRQEAESTLAKLAKKELFNLETGISAYANSNSNQARKLVSGAAAEKSIANGFTAGQHNAVAANIENLWKHAIPFEAARDDRESDPNIKKIKRFAAPFMMGGKSRYAVLTVKESVKNGHRVYSVELQELKTLRSRLDTSTNQGDSQRTPVRSVDSIIAKLQGKINPDSVSKVMRHSSFVSEVSVYEQGAAPGSASLRVISPGLAEGAAPLDYKLAQWLENGNPKNVSRVVDSDTGEPMPSVVEIDGGESDGRWPDVPAIRNGPLKHSPRHPAATVIEERLITFGDGDTPAVLRALGARNLPVQMVTSLIHKASRPAIREHKSNLSSMSLRRNSRKSGRRGDVNCW
jgi:hypothetical protein